VRAPLVVPSDRDATGRSFGAEELELVREVLESGSLNSNSGTMVRRFEHEFARSLGVARCVAVSSGSFAVQAAVFATRPDLASECVTSPITDFGALAALLYEGVVPSFCDVDAHTLMPVADTIANAITARTRAVVVTHLFGATTELAPIRALCDRHGLAMIEDAAQALGSSRDGVTAGTVGDLAAFSFQQSKHITSGEGGAVVTDDDELARRVRLFTNKAWPYGEPDPDHRFLAPNGRMTELQAAVLIAQLGKLAEGVEQRRRSARALLAETEAADGIGFHGNVDEHSFWRMPLLVDPELVSCTELAAALAREGVRCQAHYVGRPAFELEAFRERRFVAGTGFPVDYRDSRPRERIEDFPGVREGLARVLVIPWNEWISPELGREIGIRITAICRELGGDR